MPMAGLSLEQYFPVYPYRDTPNDPDVGAFISSFFVVSDRPDAHDLWASYFTNDAQVTIGPDGAQGQQGIRALRQRMWATVVARKHTVIKVFPARFQDPDANPGEAVECECMLVGDVQRWNWDGSTTMVSWAAHAVLRLQTVGQEKEWKFAKYRVWQGR